MDRWCEGAGLDHLLSGPGLGACVQGMEGNDTQSQVCVCVCPLVSPSASTQGPCFGRRETRLESDPMGVTHTSGWEKNVRWTGAQGSLWLCIKSRNGDKRRYQGLRSLLIRSVQDSVCQAEHGAGGAKGIALRFTVRYIMNAALNQMQIISLLHSTRARSCWELCADVCRGRVIWEW